MFKNRDSFSNLAENEKKIVKIIGIRFDYR